MATVSIKLPEQMIERVREAAAKEEITPDELVRDAVERRLVRGEWGAIIAFGHRNAGERGLTPEDVEAEIMAERAERGR